jgi:hypothetical protein
VASLVVVLSGTLATSAAAAPATASTAAQPAPPAPPPAPSDQACTPDSSSSLPTCQPPIPTATPPTGVPLPRPTGSPASVGCVPGSPWPQCQNPSSTAAPSPPCSGEGCIPQPTTLPPPPPSGPGPGPGQSGDSGTGGADCGITTLGGCVTNAITAFFRDVVTAALNPLLELLSTTLLTTPTLQALPRVGELWTNSWQILLACYALLILLAGVLVMAYESLQTHHSIKEIAPRVVAGFLAGAVSLWVASRAVEIANGLAQAVMGGGLDATSAGETLRNLVLGSVNGGIFIIFLGLFVAGMLLVLLVTYIVRVALTVVLVAGAPLALMFHALPQTEPIARWWWKAFGGCLAIQVVQSLALITMMRVFLAPGGFTLFGPTRSGLVNLLVALALFYILFKIPFWILGSLRAGGGRRSVVGTVARAYVIGTALGWVNPGHHGRTAGRRPPPASGPRGGGGPRSGGGPGGGTPSGGGPRGGGPRGGSGPSGRNPAGRGPSGPGPSGRGPSGGGGRGPSGGGGRGPSGGGPSGGGGLSGGGGGPRRPGQGAPRGRVRAQPSLATRSATPGVPGRRFPMTGTAASGGRRSPAAHPGPRSVSPRRSGVGPASPPPAPPPMPSPRWRVPPRRLPVDLSTPVRPGPARRPVPVRPSRCGGAW